MFLDDFDILISKIIFFKKYIILIYFQVFFFKSVSIILLNRQFIQMVAMHNVIEEGSLLFKIHWGGLWGLRLQRALDKLLQFLW